MSATTAIYLLATNLPFAFRLGVHARAFPYSVLHSRAGIANQPNIREPGSFRNKEPCHITFPTVGLRYIVWKWILTTS